MVSQKKITFVMLYQPCFLTSGQGSSTKNNKTMKAGKLFQLVFSVILIVCTTGCYDKDEVLEADNYLFKEITYAFEEEGDGFFTYNVERDPIVVTNDSPSQMTFTDHPFDNTWQETTFQSNAPEAFTWMENKDQYVNTPYMFIDELRSDGVAIKYCSGTTKTEGPNNSTATTTLDPYTRIIIKGTLQYSKIIATYTLVFVGEYTKAEKQIKGKFIQIIPKSHIGVYTTEEIPN